MSMVIQHNIPALQSYNIVNATSNALQKSIAKLSSGLRINSAADDAAGLAISEKMRSQVRGLDRAVANTQDGISLIQTAEGALSETHSILQRMRELSVQAANDTLTQQDRSYIQEEVDQLKTEITRIGNTTQFNKKKLLNGDSAALWSSDNLETKAIINGGLREVDQFGQKKSIEGNYKIRVKAEPGQGEVQKSDIMKIKHKDVLTDVTINSPDGIKDVVTDNMTPGTYSLKVKKEAAAPTDATTAPGGVQYTGSYGVAGDKYTAEATMGGGINTLTGHNVNVGTLKVTYDGQEVASVIMGTNATTGRSAADNATAINNALATGLAGTGVSATVDNTGKFTFSKMGSELANWTVTWTGAQNSAAGDGSDTAAVTHTLGTRNPATGSTKSGVKVEDIFTVASEAANNLNGSILFEVQNKDEVNDTITLRATASMLDQSGKNITNTVDNIVLQGGGDEVNLNELFGEASTSKKVTIKMTAGMVSAVKEGGKFTTFVTAKKSDSPASSVNIDLTGEIDTDWEDSWDGGPFNGKTLTYHLNADALTDTEVHFKNYMINERTGTVSEGDTTLITKDTFKRSLLNTNKATEEGHTLAAFTESYIGKVANGDVKLRDLDKFWNSEGVMMLDDAKKLTLNQGNGKTADVMLYANDTLDEVAKKINDAIATGLGQSKYVDNATKFATFVTTGTSQAEAVAGTFVIRSVVPGTDGEITFSGDQGIIDALSLNTIQESKETVYNVDVFDEHTGKVIAQNVKTTGNVAHGVIHENVDVEFGSLTGVEAKWNDSLKKYTYTSEMQSTTLHLADNTTVLQIGANEGEDLGMNIGDMRAHALGLDGVNVMSHDRAARSITIIDNAIDKVSTQRANLGAYQNRLEHTASNLTIASENLTSAESRIRDADMAKEMMEFTKLNIMLQAGNSMLAQANQQPQNVLSLIR